MPGWFRADAASASRRNRSSASRFWASASGRSLSATKRRSLLSSALYTSPMPPWPIIARISYGPRRVPAARGILAMIVSLPAAPCGSARVHGPHGTIHAKSRPLSILFRETKLHLSGSLRWYGEENKCLRKEPFNEPARMPGRAKRPARWREDDQQALAHGAGLRIQGRSRVRSPSRLSFLVIALGG